MLLPAANTHIIYDSAFAGLPADKKADLLDLLAKNETDVIIISTPATSQDQLNAVLSEAAGVPIAAQKTALLNANTGSNLVNSPYHAALLPALLSAHNDNPQGFPESGIHNGGVVAARAADGSQTPTAVQWKLPGERVVTLLGYWKRGMY